MLTIQMLLNRQWGSVPTLCVYQPTVGRLISHSENTMEHYLLTLKTPAWMGAAGDAAVQHHESITPQTASPGKDQNSNSKYGSLNACHYPTIIRSRTPKTNHWKLQPVCIKLFSMNKLYIRFQHKISILMAFLAEDEWRLQARFYIPFRFCI